MKNQFVVNADGTVISEEMHKDNLATSEGGIMPADNNNVKHFDYVSALTTLEKIELRTFVQDNAKIIGDGGRREMFRQKAASELIDMRNENDERRKKNLPLIAKEDRRLLLNNGVVKSLWRNKKEQANLREAAIGEIARFNEDVRS